MSEQVFLLAGIIDIADLQGRSKTFSQATGFAGGPVDQTISRFLKTAW